VHIALTGAAGFIGSHTAERLISRGHRVTGIDSFETAPYPAEVKRLTARKLREIPGFTLIEGDICDAEAVASAITPDVDVVCHLAALAGVRPSLDEPIRYLQVNITGTGVIIERMRQLGKHKLVFASSSSVYGAKHGTQVAAFREDDPCLTPASPYAATKRMNELQLSTYRDLFGLGVYALRFFTVYGPRQRTDMAISKFISAIADERPLLFFGDGSSRRDYTFIDDIVTGVVAAIEIVKAGEYELINLGGTSTISLSELVETIERVVGKRAKLDRQPLQPGDVPITYADVTNVADGIARQWEWFKGAQSRST
jgi:UDP-glucuronate 4-epimerase